MKRKLINKWLKTPKEYCQYSVLFLDMSVESSKNLNFCQ